MPRSRHALLPPLLALALAGTLAAGCAQPGSGVYSREETGQAAIVETGTIVSIRPVRVETSGQTGGFIGAAAGGVGGSFIGGDWRSNLLAGIAGAVVGGLVGSAAERGLAQGTATEFIVEVQGGGTIAVVQGNDDGLRVGDRVTILRGQRTRLTPARG